MGLPVQSAFPQTDAEFGDGGQGEPDYAEMFGAFRNDLDGDAADTFTVPDHRPGGGPRKLTGKGDQPSPLGPVSFSELRQSYPNMRQPVIEGLSRVGETINIVSMTKIGKSWLATMLLLCVSTGREWLGFPVRQGRVLLIDNELHPETLSHRILKVADAMMIPAADYGDTFDVLPLRGNLADVDGLRRMLWDIEPGTYRLIIIDAWYRILPAGTSENDNAQVAAIYNRLDQLADRLGCGIVCVHHTSKGSQSDKRVTDVGSGAGSQSRAVDTHIVLREHEDDDHVVLEAGV